MVDEPDPTLLTRRRGETRAEDSASADVTRPAAASADAETTLELSLDGEATLALSRSAEAKTVPKPDATPMPDTGQASGPITAQDDAASAPMEAGDTEIMTQPSAPPLSVAPSPAATLVAPAHARQPAAPAMTPSGAPSAATRTPALGPIITPSGPPSAGPAAMPPAPSSTLSTKPPAMVTHSSAPAQPAPPHPMRAATTALPALQGRLLPLPATGWARTWRLLTGVAALHWLWRGLGWVVRLQERGRLELHTGELHLWRRRALWGQALRVSDARMPLAHVRRLTRQMRFFDLHLRLGAVSLSVGVLWGGLRLGEGLLSGETVLLLIGAAIVGTGAGLDLLLGTLWPARMPTLSLQVELVGGGGFVLTDLPAAAVRQWLQHCPLPASSPTQASAASGPGLMARGVATWRRLRAGKRGSA